MSKPALFWCLDLLLTMVAVTVFSFVLPERWQLEIGKLVVPATIGYFIAKKGMWKHWTKKQNEKNKILI